MVKTDNSKIGSSKKFLSAFAVLLFILILTGLATKLVNKFVSKKLEIPSPSQPPPYLDVPLPDIQKIETTLGHPKLDELRHQRVILEPIAPGVKGKTNPFIPL